MSGVTDTTLCGGGPKNLLLNQFQSSGGKGVNVNFNWLHYLAETSMFQLATLFRSKKIRINKIRLVYFSAQFSWNVYTVFICFVKC